MLVKCKFYCVLLQLIIFASCSCEQNENSNEVNSEQVDSTLLFSFFLDKIDSTWDYSPENDSVTFEFDKYGLPKSRSEFKWNGSSNAHFSIEYQYSLTDSTETVRHLQQFGGGHTFTKIRKFNHHGKLVWKEEIDVYHNHTRIEYDSNGRIQNIKSLRIPN